MIYREPDGAADRCNSGTNSANDFSTPSYTVQRGEQIRIDSLERLVDWADGHGTGHSSRPFIYRHSNGAHRLTNCRWTGMPDRPRDGVGVAGAARIDLRLPVRTARRDGLASGAHSRCGPASGRPTRR